MDGDSESDGDENESFEEEKNEKKEKDEATAPKECVLSKIRDKLSKKELNEEEENKEEKEIPKVPIYEHTYSEVLQNILVTFMI